MIMSSRLAYGMARERLFPSVLGRLLPNRRTPWVAIVTTTVVAAALATTGDLASLASTTVLLLLIVFVAVDASVLALRWRERRADPRDPDGTRGHGASSAVRRRRSVGPARHR
jgi:amino acid transporter